SRPIAGRSRPDRWRARIARRSTISCCGSRKSSVRRRNMPDLRRSMRVADGGASMSVVDAYLGLGSRYSYLASTQFDRIARETGATFNWIPVASPDLFAPERNPFEGAPVSGQYEWFYRKQDAETWADYYGVPFREPMGRL